MSEPIQVEDLYSISDLETLKVVSDPLRIQILESIGLANRAGRLQTVKQIAAEIDAPPAKLYYHINLLEKHGLILVADTQIVSGIIEKHYRVIAHSFTIDRELLTAGTTRNERGEAVLALLDSTLDALRTDMIRMVNAIAEDEALAKRLSGSSGLITRESARLSASQAAEFGNRLLALEEEFRQMTPPEGEEGLVHSLTIVFTPVLNP